MPSAVGETETIQHRQPTAGVVAVLVAVSVWGGVAIVARKVDEIDGLVLGFHRLWIGALATAAVFYATGRRLSVQTLRFAVPGGVVFALDIVLFFSALKHTTIANATIVGALQPALVLLIAGRLFGEPATRAVITWSAIAIGGVAIVVYGSSGAPVWSPAGDLLAVGALFAWTGYFVASKQAVRTIPPFEYLTALLIVAALVVTPLALLSGQRLDPGGSSAWALIVLLAIGSGGFGHLLINWAHSHVDLAIMSLLTLAVPVVAVLSAWAFLDETVTPLQLVGMIVVLLALGAVSVRQAAGGRAPAPSETELVQH